MRHRLVRVAFSLPGDLIPCPSLSVIVSQVCPPHEHHYSCEAKMILYCWRLVVIPRRWPPDIIRVSARSVVMKSCSMHINFVADRPTTLGLIRIAEFTNYDTASRPRIVQLLRRVDESSHSESLYHLKLVKSDVVNILLEVWEMLITW